MKGYPLLMLDAADTGARRVNGTVYVRVTGPDTAYAYTETGRDPRTGCDTGAGPEYVSINGVECRVSGHLERKRIGFEVTDPDAPEWRWIHACGAPIDRGGWGADATDAARAWCYGPLRRLISEAIEADPAIRAAAESQSDRDALERARADAGKTLADAGKALADAIRAVPMADLDPRYRGAAAAIRSIAETLESLKGTV